MACPSLRRGAEPVPATTRLQLSVDHALRQLRASGLSVDASLYVDDMCTASLSREGARRAQAHLLTVLSRFGWTVHPAKSMAEPSQRIEFLGLMWDLVEKRVWLGAARAKRLMYELQRAARACARGAVRLVQLQRCIGLVVAARFAMRQSHLHLSRPLRLLRRLLRHERRRRGARRTARKQRALSSGVELQTAMADAANALAWTSRHVDAWNRRSLRPPRLVACLATDASDYGAGAVLFDNTWMVADDDGRLRLEGSARDKLSWAVPAHLVGSPTCVKEAHAAAVAISLWLSKTDKTVAAAYLVRPTRRVEGLEDVLLPLHLAMSRLT